MCLCLFTAGAEYLGRTVSIAGENLTGTEMAAALTRALAVGVVYDPISPAAYRALGFPGAETSRNMFQFGAEFEYVWGSPRAAALTRRLYPGLQSFDAWLARNASRIPLSVAVNL